MTAFKRIVYRIDYYVFKKKESIRKYIFRKKCSDLFELSNSWINKNIIIISSDCVGGRILNDYQMPVYTPTINNWYSANDFLKLCENPYYYFKIEPILGNKDNLGNYTGLIDDVVIHFGHESDPNVAIKKWKRGCKAFFRAIKDNHETCIIMNDRNGFNSSFVERFNNLPYKYKVLYSHIRLGNTPNVFYMKGEDHLNFVNVMTDYERIFSLRKRYERINFYDWFKEILSSQ